MQRLIFFPPWKRCGTDVDIIGQRIICLHGAAVAGPDGLREAAVVGFGVLRLPVGDFLLAGSPLHEGAVDDREGRLPVLGRPFGAEQLLQAVLGGIGFVRRAFALALLDRVLLRAVDHGAARAPRRR